MVNAHCRLSGDTHTNGGVLGRPSCMKGSDQQQQTAVSWSGEPYRMAGTTARPQIPRLQSAAHAPPGHAPYLQDRRRSEHDSWQPENLRNLDSFVSTSSAFMPAAYAAVGVAWHAHGAHEKHTHPTLVHFTFGHWHRAPRTASVPSQVVGIYGLCSFQSPPAESTRMYGVYV